MEQFSITTLIKLPFEAALRETYNTLAEEEFVVLTEIDLRAELLSKLGKRIRPYTILGVWLPAWEYQALKEEPDIALLMPSHVCLWDNGDGTCTLATADLRHLCEAKDNPQLGEAARIVNDRLHAAVVSVQFTGVAENITPPASWAHSS